MKIFAGTISALCLLLLLCGPVHAQQKTVAIILADGSEQTKALANSAETSNPASLRFSDPELVADVIKTSPEKNLFNLDVNAARNIGTGIGCDYLLILTSEDLRRSSSQKDTYFEAYLLAFFVDARSGKLLAWKHLDAEANDAVSAGKNLLAAFRDFAPQISETITGAAAADKQNPFDASLYEIKDNSDGSLRTPLPFRRYSPSPTALAQRLRVEVTVDIEVAIDSKGYITQTRILRWAGLGLDETVAETVRKMNFRAAVLDGKNIPARFLLRYNFHIPKEKKDQP
jgi:hypothetical protein